jgi:protein Tex
MNLQQLSEKYSIGIETLKDIIAELQTPGHDPRDDLDPPKFSSNVTDIKNLAVGDMLE